MLAQHRVSQQGRCRPVRQEAAATAIEEPDLAGLPVPAALLALDDQLTFAHVGPGDEQVDAGSCPAALVGVRVICWPTMGARLVGNASTKASICRRSSSPSGGTGNPSLPGPTNNSEKLIPCTKRNTVSREPSWRIP